MIKREGVTGLKYEECTATNKHAELQFKAVRTEAQEDWFALPDARVPRYVQEITNTYAMPKNISCAERARNTLRADFWAMESYWTQSTVEHVVGGMQLGCTGLFAAMTAEDFFNSISENAADILKETRHLLHDAKGLDKYNLNIEFWRTVSKYIYRLFHGSVELRDRKAPKSCRMPALTGVSDELLAKLKDVYANKGTADVEMFSSLLTGLVSQQPLKYFMVANSANNQLFMRGIISYLDLLISQAYMCSVHSFRSSSLSSIGTSSRHSALLNPIAEVSCSASLM